MDDTDINKDWGGRVMRKMIIKDKIYLVPYHDPEKPRMVKFGEEKYLSTRVRTTCSLEIFK